MGLKHDKQTDALFASILKLTSMEECYAYFEDLCTMREIRDLGQRLEVARLLRGGSSYQQAAAATGVSSATVGRVKKCLDYGPGGYEMILTRMEADGDDAECDEA